jgi:membrane protease subunit (stomatin/prohibitin family)
MNQSINQRVAAKKAEIKNDKALDALTAAIERTYSHRYCQDCGSPRTNTAAKFCSNCGASF